MIDGASPEFSAEHIKYIENLKRRRAFVKLTQIFILAAFFGLWELAAARKWIDPFVFSQPTRVFRAFADMAAKGAIWRHIAVTLGETAAGFLLGTASGTLIAVALWWNRFLERTLAPYLVVFNSLPKTALAPVLIVIFGNNVKSVVATALLIAVIVTVLTVLTGFLGVDGDKIKLIQTFGGNKRQTLFAVVLPSCVPTIAGALKINVGLSFVGVIVGEFLVAKEGLGYLIVYGSQIFKMDWVMMSVILLCALAALMNQVIVWIERRFSAWNS